MKQYTTTECAKLLGISQARVRQLILNNQLRAKKMGRDWIIEKEDVEKFSTQRRKPGRPKTPQ